MHIRKLMYLLMVEMCVAVCNTATQDCGVMLSAECAGEHKSNSSTYIQMDSNDAEITDSVQIVTEKSTNIVEKGTIETSTNETITGTRSKNDFKKKNENADSKKEKQNSATTVTINEQMSNNGEQNQSDVVQSAVETNDEGAVEANVQEVPQVNIEENLQEPEVPDNYYESDYIVIKGQTIPISYGKATQGMVDANEVVQDTGLIEGTNNTFLFGHNDRSFSILDTVNCGETITINNYGVTKNYQVERSELAILTDDETDIVMFNDGGNVVYRDYGFPALVLITCAGGYGWNYRWIIIAKEMC